MTRLLICNIGNRDILLPMELLPAELHKASHRDKIKYIRTNKTKIDSSLQITMIKKVIDYLEADSIDWILLFGTQQSNPNYQPTDTFESAELMRELLIERWNFRPEQVLAHAVPVNPTRQNELIRFYEAQLTQYDSQIQPSQVFLEVTGGTPAMSNALQLAGTEMFQARAVALYVTPDSMLPERLSIGRRILGGPLRKLIQANLTTFQYHAALDSWHLYRPYFTDLQSESSAKVIEGMLAHATARVNLDVPQAILAIRDLVGLADGLYDVMIHELYNALTPLSHENALAEVLALAEIRLQSNNYADFLTQLVRYVENSLRLVCLRLNIPFINWQGKADPYGAKVDAGWLRQQRIEKINVGQSGLQRLLSMYAPNDSQVQLVLKFAKTCQPLIELRNEITHSLGGVSQIQIEQAFGDSASGILSYIQHNYQQLTQRSPNQNPYHAINQWINQLLQ